MNPLRSASYMPNWWSFSTAKTLGSTSGCTYAWNSERSSCPLASASAAAKRFAWCWRASAVALGAAAWISARLTLALPSRSTWRMIVEVCCFLCRSSRPHANSRSSSLESRVSLLESMRRPISCSREALIGDAAKAPPELPMLIETGSSGTASKKPATLEFIVALPALTADENHSGSSRSFQTELALRSVVSGCNGAMTLAPRSEVPLVTAAAVLIQNSSRRTSVAGPSSKAAARICGSMNRARVRQNEAREVLFDIVDAVALPDSRIGVIYIGGRTQGPRPPTHM
mmetsp:Transcript_7685/g.14332  ORF Transcript_7685/g.14332 Transcript_7685/m.14332 type:complete len:286 (+) Transcript_7685:305-1162(+)